MSTPGVAAEYAEREVQAAYSVLIELGQVLGAYRESFVIIGGAVPWLLLREGTPPHVGTLDVDLALDPAALAGEEYATLVETLERAGYERDAAGLKPFQLRRLVQVDEGPPIPILVDLLMPRDAELEKHRPPLVDGLRVQRADGADVALSHHETKTFDGKMPDGRHNSVQVHVATIPALLVMKGYALTGRDKKKDAYDIYYCVRNFPGGPEALAGECIELLDDPVARKGYERIAAKFQREDDFGPSTVRLFLAESDLLGGMTPDQLQVDAFRQVHSWWSALAKGGK